MTAAKPSAARKIRTAQPVSSKRMWRTCAGGARIIVAVAPPTDSATRLIDPTAEVSPRARLGEGCRVWRATHIREGAELGAGCIIGANVYIGADVRLGRHCKVQNQALLYEGLTLEDGVFVGPRVCFTND